MVRVFQKAKLIHRIKLRELDMTYGHLLDLHQLIDHRLAEGGQSVDNTKDDPGETRFHEGRIEFFRILRTFRQKI